METMEFRFWDAWNEVMIYSEGLKLSKFFEMFEKLQEGENNPILMRSTGKTDKNGNKIFEGDQLRGFGQEPIMTVSFDDGSFSVHNRFGYWGSLQRFIEILEKFNEPLEIIGNIHENEGK